MNKVRTKEKLWVEKYRPSCIEDMILPQKMKNQLKKMVENDSVPNLLLASSEPGLGKSSVVHVLLDELNADFLWINGSKEGIDILRDKVSVFASTESIDGGRKIVVIDEADHLGGNNPQAQAAMRGLIEDFSLTTSFVFTVNYQEKLIKPLVDRFQDYNFDEIMNNKENKAELAMQLINRIQFILTNENVQYEQDDIKNIVTSLYPSYRRIIHLLEKSSSSGVLELDKNVLDNITAFSTIMEYVKDSNFAEMRKTIQDLSDPNAFYTYVYKNLDDFVIDESKPLTIIETADYQDMSSRARDPIITLAAYCVKLMAKPEIKFKKD